MELNSFFVLTTSSLTHSRRVCQRRSGWQRNRFRQRSCARVVISVWTRPCHTTVFFLLCNINVICQNQDYVIAMISLRFCCIETDAGWLSNATIVLADSGFVAWKGAFQARNTGTVNSLELHGKGKCNSITLLFPVRREVCSVRFKVI